MKKSIVIICIIVMTLVLVFFFTQKDTGDTVQNGSGTVTAVCEGVDKGNVRSRVKMIDDAMTNYTSSTKDIFGKSAEGGQQTNYSLDGTNRLIAQTFYSETGKSEISYYLEDGKVFYFLKRNSHYLVPISENSSGTVKDVELNEFYLGENQNLCFWYSNGEMRPNTQAAEDTVKFLVSDLQ